MKPDNIFLQLNLCKSFNTDKNGNFIFEVEASNENLDLEQQRVLQQALLDSRDYFLSNGVVSKDHLHRRTDAQGNLILDDEMVIGEPVDVYTDGSRTFVRGILYKTNKYARQFIEKLKDGSTRVKASVGGLFPIVKTTADGVGEVVSVLWNDLALTLAPVNATVGSAVIGKSLNSVQLVQLVKGFEEGKHPRTEDGKFTSGVDTNGKREPYNSSTTKAKELKAEDWGTPEEIIEMATMPRTAKNRKEAVEILKTVIDEKNIKSISGVIAYIPKKNIGKIVSRQAIDTSLSEQAHYHAVANIDKLFSNAIEKWQFELNPNKNNEGLKDRKYLYAPMEYKERIIPVKITVKEYKNEEKEKQIYTIEAIDVGIDKNGEECPDHVEDGVITKTIALYTPLNDIPHGVFNLVSFNSPPDTNNLPYLFDDVNVSLVFQSALQSPQGLPATGEGNPHDANIIGKSFKEDEHPRTENGKFTSGTADTNGKREPYNSSTTKAKELKAEDWGTPEEIVEMATMPRTAKNRKEAKEAIENIISDNGKTNRASVKITSRSGLSAYLRRSSIGKLTSSVQKKSMPEAAIYRAAANIDKLYSNAIEPWGFELNPEKNNDDLKDRRILYAPMEYQGYIIPVKITVKEYKSEDLDNKLYSVEAIDVHLIKVEKGTFGPPIADVFDINQTPSFPQERPFIESTGSFKLLSTKNLSHLFDNVNVVCFTPRTDIGATGEKNSHDTKVIGKSFKEDEHPREEDGKFTSGTADINNGENHRKLLNLKDSIGTILHGTTTEREKLNGQHFHIADTPQFMKDLGLEGDYFSIRYGVITHHKGKDADHNLTEENWKDLCDAITKPFAIARYKSGYRLFTAIKTPNRKYIVAGVDVKSIGKGIEVNSVKTVFGYTDKQDKQETLIYKSEKITPEQTALLDGLNSLSLPSVQELSTSCIHFNPRTLRGATGEKNSHDTKVIGKSFKEDEHPREENGKFTSGTADINNGENEAVVAVRKVSSISEAESVIKELIKTKKDFTNKVTNLTASISSKSIEKMGSEKAAKKSVSSIVHAHAIANIDNLFENAQIHITHPDVKGDSNIKQIHRFGTIMKYDGKYYPIKITVKEFVDGKKGKRIYSVEAVKVEEINKSAGQLTFSHDEHSRIVPIADFNKKVFQSTVDGAFGTYFPRTLPSTQIFNNMHKTGKSQAVGLFDIVLPVVNSGNSSSVSLHAPIGATGEKNSHDTKVIGKSFKEDEHPREENGKFTSGTADVNNGKNEGNGEHKKNGQAETVFNDISVAWLTQGTGLSVKRIHSNDDYRWVVKVDRRHKDSIGKAVEQWRAQGYWADYDKRNGYIDFRTNAPLLTVQELKLFIEESVTNPSSKEREVFIGQVKPDSAKKIKELINIDVINIITNSNSIWHAYRKKEHNLEPDDFLYAVDVINTATDVSPSSKKHKDNNVLIFKKDINGGEITFLAEVRVSRNALLIMNCYRQRKSRQDPNATKLSQGANVQNELPHYTSIPIVSDNQMEKSSMSGLFGCLLVSIHAPIGATYEENPHDGKIIGKSFKEDEHPREENGKFTNVKERIRNAIEETKKELTNNVPGEHIPLVKIPIKQVDKWMVDKVMEVTGIDITGFQHELSNDVIRHFMKNHGDSKKEIERGNLPLSSSDLENIPDIIGNPDYVVIGAKRYGFDKVIYAKNGTDGTTLYFEELLVGNKNKSLRSNTIYKTNKVLNENDVLDNIKRNAKTDMSNATKITVRGKSLSSNGVRVNGSHPTLHPSSQSGLAAATSAVYADYPLSIPQCFNSCQYNYIFVLPAEEQAVVDLLEALCRGSIDTLPQIVSFLQDYGFTEEQALDVVKHLIDQHEEFDMGVNLQTVLGNLKKSLGLKKSLDDLYQLRLQLRNIRIQDLIKNLQYRGY